MALPFVTATLTIFFVCVCEWQNTLSHKCSYWCHKTSCTEIIIRKPSRSRIKLAQLGKMVCCLEPQTRPSGVLLLMWAKLSRLSASSMILALASVKVLSWTLLPGCLGFFGILHFSDLWKHLVVYQLGAIVIQPVSREAVLVTVCFIIGTCEVQVDCWQGLQMGLASESMQDPAWASLLSQGI